MNLFDYRANQIKSKEEPLAARMRPLTLDEIVGQEHILGKGKLLYRAIQADKLGSLILYGPPGTGKTTIARVIAHTTEANFCQVNATIAGKKDLEETVRNAKESLGKFGRRTILFVDEIHRFNKAQQDYLLPFVEDGTVILIGATTENPYFEVNGALLSRSRIFELKPLSVQDLETLARRTLADEKRGLGKAKIRATDEALSFLADRADGDARAVLNALELAALTTDPDAEGHILLDLRTAEECIQRKQIRYDKSGDNHYDVISAYIKSIRGSDPDAAVYYLARMLEAGEDVRFIARRLMIACSEDVGNAEPEALRLAVAASLAVERVGMPEARIILAQATCFAASSPKSNAAYLAISRAESTVREKGNLPVPAHLRDANYKSARKLGRGIDYIYPHDYPDHFVAQQYLPVELAGVSFYEPGDLGREKQMRAWLYHLRPEKKTLDRGGKGPGPKNG